MKVFINYPTNRSFLFDNSEPKCVELAHIKDFLKPLMQCSVYHNLCVGEESYDILVQEQKIILREANMVRVLEVLEEIHPFTLKYLGNECGDLRFELIWEDV